MRANRRLTVFVDHSVRSPYQVGYGARVFDGLRYGPKADADTQLTVFKSTASEKQILIF